MLKLDRIRSGLPHDIVHTRSFLVRSRDGEIKLRIILDRCSLEVFVNDGEQAASALLMPIAMMFFGVMLIVIASAMQSFSM